MLLYCNNSYLDMKKIVLFNHKGGVSKTTSTFHIGWMLANLGKKVLLVDADPQCNLTSLFLGDKFDEYFDEDSPTVNNNIKDGVWPAFTGSATQIRPFECPKAERNHNLFLLPGHMNLSECDSPLSFAITSNYMPLQSLPGSFNDLIEKCANQYNIDYVFIDLNPGLSAINQILFLCSDAFIVPTNPDSFSVMSIKSLASILPRWVEWKNNNISHYATSPYPLPPSTPSFIGVIPQRFNVRNGSATKPFREKIEEQIDIIKTLLVPELQKKDMVYSNIEYDNAGIDRETFCLEEIKDFLTLSPKSLRINVPVFELSNAELSAVGTVLKSAQENRETFRAIYSAIAEKIMKICHD